MLTNFQFDIKALHDRMPVILHRRDYERWLAPADPSRLPVDLLRRFPAEEMKAWPVALELGMCETTIPLWSNLCPGLALVCPTLIIIRDCFCCEFRDRQCCVSAGDTNGGEPSRRGSFLPETNTQRIRPTASLPVSPRQQLLASNERELA